MKIVVAPDSFKESLGADEVAHAIAQGIRQVYPEARIEMLPMADGGEGTLDVVAKNLAIEPRNAAVLDALGQPCQARWLWIEPATALIEMAGAAGLAQIAPQARDVMQANTFGVGLLVREALDHGAKTIVLTAGGSATNDAGIGMLHALGLRFKDVNGTELAPTPQGLVDISHVDASGLDARIPHVTWIIATDVNNPLCGPQGASSIFGPQKGASTEQIKILDDALSRFATITAQCTGKDLANTPGAGAGGGFAFAAIAWLDAKVQPGAQLVAEWIGLDAQIRDASLVITGEGRLDGQTAHGKAPMHVIRRAQAYGVPVVALAGSLGPGYQNLYQDGLSAAFSLVSGPMDLQQACQQAPELLQDRACDLMRTISLGAGILKARRSGG